MDSVESPPHAKAQGVPVLGPPPDPEAAAPDRAELLAEGGRLRSALTALVAARRALQRQPVRDGDPAAAAVELHRLGQEETRLHRERARVDAALRRLRGDDN